MVESTRTKSAFIECFKISQEQARNAESSIFQNFENTRKMMLSDIMFLLMRL